MYTLYFLPGACSLATQTILNELEQPVTLIHKGDVSNFSQLNPAGTVPVLVDGDHVLNEGVAILLYLLNRHENKLLPLEGLARQRAIENMLFANASMHPAYSRLFFSENNIQNPEGKQEALNAAAKAINTLWDVVERKLGGRRFLGGEQISPADIMLTVYSRWGQFFPVDIHIGPQTQAMLDAVAQRESFRLALERENEYRRKVA